MTNSDISNQIKDLSFLVLNQGKKISHLMNTIKAYQLKELNMEESASYLGITISTLRNLCSSGKLKGFKKGKFRYFKLSELEEYLSNF